MVEQKKCEECGTLMQKNSYKYNNTPYEHQWKRLKYCSRQCEARAYNKKKTYKLRQSEHNDVVNKLSKMLNAEIIHINGKGYFEDLRKEETCYEVQMLSSRPLLQKCNKWDKKDKHFLIVSVPQKVIDSFDGVMFFINNKIYYFNEEDDV